MTSRRQTDPHLHVVEPLVQETSVFSYDIEDGCFIEVLSGPLGGKQVPMVKKVLTIGRDANADVTLPDAEVSTKHAEIVRQGSSFTLRDAGSRNGVEFRGQLVDEVPLANGDEFSICRTRFRFRTATQGDDSDILDSGDNTQVTAVGKRPEPKRPWVIPVLIGTPIILALGWYGASRSDLPKVEVARVEISPLEQATTFSGRLVPRTEVRLFASVSAPVVRVLAKEGQKVSTGDPIVELDPEILGMALEKAKAELTAGRASVRATEAALKQAERKLREDRSLARKGILSRAEVDATGTIVNSRRSDRSNAQAKLRLAETALAQARRDHKDTVVRAPISGQVTSINIKIGEAPRDLRGVPVATIEDSSELLVEISASEAKVGLLRPGQLATMRVSGVGLATDLKGKVVQVAPTAEQPTTVAAAARFTARVSIENRHERLRPGMQAQVRIVTAAKEAAMVVPLSAMVTGGRSDRGVSEQVAVVEPGSSVVKWATVQTDLISTHEVEVVAGLKEGQLVISGPVDTLLTLKDGDEVSFDLPK